IIVAREIALGPLDLDHARAGIGQPRRAVGGGDRLLDAHHQQAVQRSGHIHVTSSKAGNMPHRATLCHSAAMVELASEERDVAAGRDGQARAVALRIVADTARMLGAARLVPIASAHIDGCLYHGDSGTLFAERLVDDGGAVAVPTTLNVGALDLLHAGRVRLEPERAAMARRLMDAYRALGCQPTWTCAPYQAGHRPAFGQHVAWGESNAVVFCNSVLGARTERYGDFLDICAALSARAPETGLHLDDNRRPTLLVDCSRLERRLVEED